MRIFPRRGLAAVIIFTVVLAFQGPPAPAADGAVITTFAGSVGSGPATSVAFAPLGLALRGSELLVVDQAWDVIRAIDLTTRQARVIAGTGFEGVGGDGLATGVPLSNPYGVAVDSAGTVYFTEPFQHRVRRLGADGRISTVAGTGVAGYSGDGGPAIEAALNFPNDIAVDSSDRVYLSDSFNNRVRRMARDGRITTVAGTGEQGFSGDGGPALLARFDMPGGLAVDSANNLFIVDQQLGRRVRRVSPLGAVTTVAGGGPRSDDPSGPATAMELDIARDVEPDGSGGFYVSGTHSVTHVDAGGWAERFAGNGYWPARRGEPNGDGGPATAAQLQTPEGLTRSAAGDLYIADSGNARIRKVASGTITSVAGSSYPWTGGDGGPAAQGQLERPWTLEFDADGNLLFIDNSFVRQVGVDGRLATLVGHSHRSPCPSDGAAARSVDACASGADAGPGGRLYFAEPQGYRVWTVGPDGVVRAFAGTGQRGTGGDGQAALATPLDYPIDVEATPTGDVFFMEHGGTGGSRVRRVDRAGIISTVAGGGTDTGEGVAARQALISGSALDIGPDGSIYIAEFELHRVRKIGPDGRIRTVAGTGRRGRGPDGVPAVLSDLNDPREVAVAPDGTFYVSDSANHRVRHVAADGTITTVAGRGSPGFSGDGASATAAEFNYPFGVAVDANGVLFVADMLNRRIRRVVPGNGEEPDPEPADGDGGGTTAGDETSGGATSPQRSGYWMLDAGGSVYAFGDAPYHGGGPSGPDAVDLEPTPTGHGYWVLDAAGSVHARGDAALSRGPLALAAGERATSLSATPSGAGYWIFTTAGRAFTFGDAAFHGDMAGRPLNAPVLDSVPTPSGGGYYMVAADGGIFTFGDARFVGSMGNKRLNAPVQSLVPDGDNIGYWLVASDGGIFAFDAPFRGSMGGAARLNRPVTGMVRFGNGYLMVGEDGGIFNFSDRQFHGSLGDRPPARPVTSVAVLED